MDVVGDVGDGVFLDGEFVVVIVVVVVCVEFGCD